MLEIILKSIVIGALGGAAIAAGAARMFHAPKLQGMGAFRTLGEMNACNGDPISHFSFGLGFLITSAAAALGTGALTQDVLHRVIPNWAASIVTRGGKKENLQNPANMLIAGAFIGMIVFVLLNTVSSLVPVSIATVARAILTPAANNMINLVMPLLFLWAALDSGKTTGLWSISLAGVMMLVSGNSLPGIIFGILIGNTAEEKGYKAKSTRTLIAVVIIMILMIAYFRGFHTKFLAMFGI
ncbi:DUF4311 domain-containing protein [Youngiibacter multivorans]|uniref:Uncharacterized protein (TIGR03580 family) n=1 Tax=Youngiibacter multivorans TaxID=937251 RepID=A0ABS4G848_9CLOT|nr:DUF4311 domain-containing protein [Youngiibacter multivorans]MBP1920711.1 uncharacterized protein (TIGR03580 family) [Youngiibacter multivorans]